MSETFSVADKVCGASGDHGAQKPCADLRRAAGRYRERGAERALSEYLAKIAQDTSRASSIGLDRTSPDAGHFVN
jgi:hypothetical protein